jgi:hypothetical protein
MKSTCQYLGGFHWASEPKIGDLNFDEEGIQLVDQRNKILVKVGISVIDSIEVMSEQVAKSNIDAVLVFGVLGGLAAAGAKDRGTLLVHLNGADD